jgi:hypothetical protein
MQRFHITRRLTGTALSRRLATLQETIVLGHRNATKKNDRWLLHVKAVGDALREAKRRLGHRTKWSRWRNKLIDEIHDAGMPFSVRTAQVYALVAGKWEEPLVMQMRASGNVTSISAFVKVLQLSKNAERRKALHAERAQADPKETKLHELQEEAVKNFRNSLKALKKDALSELCNNWYLIWPECARIAQHLAAFGWWRPNLALEHYLEDGTLPNSWDDDEEKVAINEDWERLVGLRPKVSQHP